MKLIKDIFILFIFSAVIALCNYALNSHRPNTELLPDELTFEMLAKLPPPIMFIDARSEEEFSSGHLENAYNISESQFDAHLSAFLDDWLPESVLVVYCNPGTCNSSRNIADRLKSRYKNLNFIFYDDKKRKYKHEKV